jgi:uncharacterized protein
VLDVLLLLMTFGLGALFSRVSLCAVGAVQQRIVFGKSAGLKRLLLAAAGSGVTLLLCAAWAPDMLRLPADSAFHWGIVAGGLLLGIGALINGGCYLGSVLYFGTGNMNFLFTLLGIGLGLRSAPLLAPLAKSAGPGLRMSVGAQWLWGVSAFAVIIVVLVRGKRHRGTGLWLALLAGLLAGLVYARQPGWSYGTALETLFHGRWDLAQWRTSLSALTLFAGAIGEAALAGRFFMQPPNLQRALRCLAGGAVMGLGAALVPGGNDNLLLWAIPGLTRYGLLAYALMLGVIVMAFMLPARWPRTPRAPAQ